MSIDVVIIREGLSVEKLYDFPKSKRQIPFSWNDLSQTGIINELRVGWAR